MHGQVGFEFRGMSCICQPTVILLFDHDICFGVYI